MGKAGRVCSVAGCPAAADSGSRCAEHERQAEQSRGSAATRGYGSRAHRAFRARVLARQPVCVVCRQAPATVADHHPWSRRELIEHGLNPNAPEHGRGLCHTCHSTETARLQPGGLDHNNQ